MLPVGMYSGVEGPEGHDRGETRRNLIQLKFERNSGAIRQDRFAKGCRPAGYRIP